MHPFGAVESPLHAPISQASAEYAEVFRIGRTKRYEPFVVVCVRVRYLQQPQLGRR
jgi:hypothetical protein